MSKYEMDCAWAQFKQVVSGYIPSQQEIIDTKWRQMAQTSSLKRQMLEKQRNLRARMRAL